MVSTQKDCIVNEKIEGVLNFIREARDEADTLEERIVLFVAMLTILVGIVAIGSMLLFLAFTLPRVFIPIYLTIFILWQGYKRI